MKVDFLDRRAVHERFRVRDARERILRARTNRVAERHAVQDFHDMTEVPMLVLVRELEVNAPAGNAPPHYALGDDCDSTEIQLRHELVQPFGRQTQVEKSAECHVAAGAGEWVEDQRLHEGRTRPQIPI